MRPELRRGRGGGGDRPASDRRAGVLQARPPLQQSRGRRSRRIAPDRAVTPALLILWLHLLSAVVWVGGLVYQTHVLLPAARRGGAAAVADMLRRGRPPARAAGAPPGRAGVHNVTPPGPLRRGVGGGDRPNPTPH